MKGKLAKYLGHTFIKYSLNLNVIKDNMKIPLLQRTGFLK